METDCCYCKHYPCVQTDKIHTYIIKSGTGLKITLNGCDRFKKE